MSKMYGNRGRTEHMKSTRVSIQSRGIGGLILVLAVMVGCRSTPQKYFTTWKVFELRKDLRGDYDKAWEAIVKVVDRRYGVESYDEETGYIRSRWIYSNADDYEFRTRLAILLQWSAVTFKMRAEPQHRDNDEYSVGRWRPDTDGVLRSRTYYDLVNEVGRTVLNE